MRWFSLYKRIFKGLNRHIIWIRALNQGNIFFQFIQANVMFFNCQIYIFIFSCKHKDINIAGYIFLFCFVANYEYMKPAIEKNYSGLIKLKYVSLPIYILWVSHVELFINIIYIYMGQFPQDGNLTHIYHFFKKFEGLVWPHMVFNPCFFDWL